MWYCFVVFTFLSKLTNADPNIILREVEEQTDLETLLVEMMNRLTEYHEISCMTFLSDPVYLNVFEGAMFKRTIVMPYIMIVVTEYEDLLSPNYLTVQALRQARKDGCNVYVIFVANGLQTARLLRFGDRHRVLDTRAKYILLHDFRLYHSDLHYIWKRIVNVVFLRHYKKVLGLKKSNSWFDISTVPFPNPIRAVMVPKRVDIWREGRFYYNRVLFKDKTVDLRGEVLNVVYWEHVPSVVGTVTNDTDMHNISGVEIEILNTLASKMNFIPKLYQSMNSDIHRWGHKQMNGTFSGLLGEMVNGKADVALGNLQYTPYHLQLTDLTIPYTTQCHTFLTPEALSDNSWKTLILPFKPEMWLAVLLVLLITGAIFYGMSHYYVYLVNYHDRKATANTNANEKAENKINIHDNKLFALYLFDNITNSILYTYGMLLVVSLPKLPMGWSIRILTGWYWLYCILLVVSYRASMTAILANPAPRVTIDTLEELVNSKVTCGGWGSETKRFFVESIDPMTRKIGEKLETINSPDVALRKIARGNFAYYDNEYFLKYLSMKGRHHELLPHEEFNNMTNMTEVHHSGPIDEGTLHIMSDCVVNIPISIGLQKNSPLKPLTDKYIRRIVEVGLVEKWLKDVMYLLRSAEIDSIEEVKAVMNLKKLYAAFVALAIGYTMSAVTLLGEILHWHLVVRRDPKYDKYAMDIYYLRKSKKH